MCWNYKGRDTGREGGVSSRQDLTLSLVAWSVADRNVKIRLSGDRLTSELMSDMNFGDELGHDVMVYLAILN